MSTRAASSVEPLCVEQAQLLIVDLQERLLPHIDQSGGVLAQCARLIRAAEVMEIPQTLSEQYPAGLGRTTPAIAAVVPQSADRIEKTAFSVCGDDRGRARLAGLGRPQVLVIGIETHVCVLQTVLDLLDLGLQPYVLADAVGSRRPFDHEIAVRRMQTEGVRVMTVESAIYRLMRVAGTELFRRILPIVK